MVGIDVGDGLICGGWGLICHYMYVVHGRSMKQQQWKKFWKFFLNSFDWQPLIRDGLQELNLWEGGGVKKKENEKKSFTFCWGQKIYTRKGEKDKQRSDVWRFVCEKNWNKKLCFLFLFCLYNSFYILVCLPLLLQEWICHPPIYSFVSYCIFRNLSLSFFSLFVFFAFINFYNFTKIVILPNFLSLFIFVSVSVCVIFGNFFSPSLYVAFHIFLNLHFSSFYLYNLYFNKTLSFD